jgi:hypothetical protein
MKQTILNINETYTVENHPWGFQRKTKAFHKIEFSSTRGFRYVFQTIDPKTSRLCNPKPGTYDRFVYLYKDGATGYIESAALKFNSYEHINSSCEFIAEHFDKLQLTKEMNQYLYNKIQSQIYINVGFTTASQRIALLAFIKPMMDLLKESIRTGENIFSQIKLDLEKIKEIEKGA